jgi:hypothetical protein
VKLRGLPSAESYPHQYDVDDFECKNRKSYHVLFGSNQQQPKWLLYSTTGYHQGTITNKEEIELLDDATDSKDDYDSYITLAMKDEPPITMSFSETDSECIQTVTGVNTVYRKWTDYVIVHRGPDKDNL